MSQLGLHPDCELLGSGYEGHLGQVGRLDPWVGLLAVLLKLFHQAPATCTSELTLPPMIPMLAL